VWFGHRAARPADVATAREVAETVRRARIETQPAAIDYAMPR
jgi:hypothetical protein